MESTDLISHLLDLLAEPAFSVKDGTIRLVNSAAQQLDLHPGIVVSDLIHIGKESYAEFNQGCLYLTLTVSSAQFGASVTRVGNTHIFRLVSTTESYVLRAYALAAQHLRNPISNVVAVSNQLLDDDRLAENPLRDKQASQLSRSLYQLQRLVGNMSDAGRYVGNTQPIMEVLNLTALFREIMDKAAYLAESADIRLQFTPCSQEVLGSANQECIERAVYNLLSNAIKFSPAGSVIQAKLSRKNNLLCFTLQDEGNGMPASLQGNAFSRFQRTPAVEDSKNGIGLGLLLVRSAATAHGGTVLLEQPEGRGLRVTMTITIRQDHSQNLRFSALRIDPWSGRDPGLVELSDALPADAFQE